MSIKDSAVSVISSTNGLNALCACGRNFPLKTSAMTIAEIKRNAQHECALAPNNFRALCAECGMTGQAHAYFHEDNPACSAFVAPHPCRSCRQDVGRGQAHRFGCALHGARQIKLPARKRDDS